ncbi:hypothetical protein QUW15_11265, partial [Desulfovibrio piger]|nr:hypothetical protein [Desulfovibrio piger]
RIGEQVGGMLAREYAREQQTRLEESLLAARREFSEWQAAYEQEHQGGNALRAGADFSAKMQEITQRHMEAFDGAENEVFRRELGGRMAAMRLRAGELGASYEARERASWENSVLEGLRAQLLADAENDPDNGAWLDFQLAEYGRALEARGLDATADMLELSRDVRLRRGVGMLRRGKLAAAEALTEGREDDADALRLRGMVEATRRERAARAGVAAAGFADAAERGSATGDFSAAWSLVREVEALDAGEGRKLRQRLHARQSALEAMRLEGDRSLLEQRDAALKALGAGTAEERGEAEACAGQRLRAYREDPAAFAAQARPELLTEELDTRERARRLLEAQRALGRGLDVAPRVLTRAQAADMERTFMESEPQTRLRLLSAMREDYGPYFAAAATEAGLPAPVVALGTTLEQLPPSRAAALLAAATAREGDIPGADADARAQARGAVARLDFMRGLSAMSRRFPRNRAARALVASWERTLRNAALLGVDPEEAASRFDVRVNADPDAGGGHMLFLPRGSLPGGWDADDVAEAAEAAREVVRQRLTEALPQGATAPQRRMLERGARHAAESGVWLSAADGGGVHLVDGDAGRPVTYPDGEPVAFSLRELAAIAADRRRAGSESPAGLHNRLSGEGR